MNELIIERINNAYKNCKWDILSEESSMLNRSVSKELKEREFYTKPSIKRREKRAKAKLRHKKNLKTN